MTPTTTIGTPDAVFLYSGPDELYREHRPVLDALGGGHTHLGEDIGRAAAYDIALLDIFWTAMAGYAHALALAGAEGIGARELAPFAKGIGAILPPIFEQAAEDVARRRVLRRGQPDHVRGVVHGSHHRDVRSPRHRRAHDARGGRDGAPRHRARTRHVRIHPHRRVDGSPRIGTTTCAACRAAATGTPGARRPEASPWRRPAGGRRRRATRSSPAP
ncbi:hypothetical protein LUX73_24585 [Actinomadura madurae]|nr:hypothetical protein [Actinomadura madurae]MCQ0007539.1 hypothetical protein [Actinomadura madurae]